jgi:hypothetical protein
MTNFTDRVIRAAKLEVGLYEEVEADKGAFGQAMGVVVLSSIAAGIGNIGHGGTVSILGGVISALIGWFIWAYLTYLIGTKLLPESQTQSGFSELLRTIGFASAPGLLRVLGFIPVVGWLITVAAGVWMLLAMVVAVRQALDYQSTARAVGVCLIGWVVQVGIIVLLFVFFAGSAITATP